MARLTARIKRLEALDGARRKDELDHLSEAELDARACQAGERLTALFRDNGMSVAAFEAECGRPLRGRLAAAVSVELAAPAFNAARFLATMKGQLANAETAVSDVPQE